VVDSNAIYTIYLNPTGTTNVTIEGVSSPYTGGVNINTPILSVDSNIPADPCNGEMINITADVNSTDNIYTVNIIYQANSEARQSAIMDYNSISGLWETQIGPFSWSDDINYYISATDNSGRREISGNKNFVIPSAPDLGVPQWRNQGQSSATPAAGSSVDLFAEGKDAIALRYATLATDETGTWEKKTAYGSPMSMGDVADTWTLSSFTWSNPAIPEGNTVSWKIYYEDASGNEIVTDVMSFTLQTPDLNAPNYFDPYQSSTTAGQTAEFGLRWTDNVALDGYIFSFDNGTGSFVDDSAVDFTPADGWWDPNWNYRKAIIIDNNSGAQALTDYALLVSLDTESLIAAGKMNPHGGDIRFIDANDSNELDFWIEADINTPNTRIWVEVPNIADYSSKIIYMYYGSSNHRVAQSNGQNVFHEFDDFGGRGWEEFKYSGNPVMGPGSTALGRGTFSSVMRENDTSWRMYSSYDTDNSDIGLSTSTDGISWTHQGVVLRKDPNASAWDSTAIWCPAVWKEDDVYYMLYAARGPSGISMGLAMSADGLTFDKYAGNPVFSDPDWASGDTEGPCFSALKEDGIYYVMYNTLGGHRQSSITASSDLINWARVYNSPRFTGGASGSDWNYNTFCGNVFKYDDMFYLVIPGQDSSKNYAKFGLYASSSPTFPQDDTEFKGIVMTGDPTGWEHEDMDTPWVVEFNDKMHMYYAACGSCWSQTGLVIMDDIASVLTQAYPPGNYIGLDRTASASLQIMPPANWQKSISGYLEVDSQNFEITLDSSVTGRSVVQYDGNSVMPLELYKDIDSLSHGSISAWIKASNTSTGDYDLYVYGDSQSSLALVVGLGGNGVFHYWNGSFTDTAVAYSSDTWYQVQIDFNTVSDKYNFAVYDTSFSELLRVDDIDFGTTVSSGIDRINFRTSSGFNGNAYLDDVRVRTLAAAEPVLAVGSEATPVLTEAWSRVTKTLTSSIGATIRWKVSANDTSDNWTVSDIYSFTTQGPDFPPTVVLDSPEDNIWSDVNMITFSGTCTDDSNITSVSLYGDWGGSWSLIDTNSSPGLNGQLVPFTETLPEGTWTWNIKANDDNAQSNWATTRSINVDTTPTTWWHSNYLYRKRLTIQENSGQDLTNYPLYVTLDTASLISGGKMQPDCNDIRIVYMGNEIPSQIIGPGATDTQIWFQLDLTAFETEYEVYLYYGNAIETEPNYASQTSMNWDNFSLVMDTGKLTATFDSDGGIISQIKHNTNNQQLMNTSVERGLGYLFSNNPAVYYIFRVDESDDTVALTEDGPILKIVTAYSGESPQWIQENVFYNGQEFIDFKVYRPLASTEKYLTGTNGISPDGLFSASDTDELLRVDDWVSDSSVTFDDSWRFDPTNNMGYAGVIDPCFTNQLAFVWNQSYTSDFTWKPRIGGAYALFIGGNGVAGTYGTIDSNQFDYRFILNHTNTPDNANTQSAYDSYVTSPATVSLSAEQAGGVDITPPIVTITSPINMTYSTDTISLNYSASEATSWCGYSLNGEPNVTIANCENTTITGLANGTYDLVVYATDFMGLTGSASVTFTVDVQTTTWWDTDWNFRIPVSINTEDFNRVNEPIEHLTNFTDKFTQLGSVSLTFDINSVRVVEVDSNGVSIAEVPSQFDVSVSYDPNTNAAGTVVWIMDGLTDANDTRNYYIYFHSTDNNKPAPVYLTDLSWDLPTKVLSNTSMETTIASTGTDRSGLSSLKHNSTEYLTNNGMVYIDGKVDTYETLIQGPVKNTIKLTALANGSINVTLYDLAESIKIQGHITGSGWPFTPFPYTWSISSGVCTNTLNYYDGGGIVTEVVSGNQWLGHAPQEGWACYQGIGANKDFCLVTDSDTLADSNNLWRHDSGGQQLMMPGFNPNPTFPIDPVSWIVMTDTYQDGRVFWNKLSAPVNITESTAESLSYTITASAGANGTVDPNGIINSTRDSNQPFTATPDAGYLVDQWFLDGNSVQVGSTTYTLNDIQADHTVNVTFKAGAAALTITATAGANGAIDPHGVIVKAYDANQIFTAIPDIGYTVNTWYLDGNDLAIIDPNYTLSNIQADHTVHVDFVIGQRNLTSSSTAGGVVTVPGEAGPYTYDYGTVATITASENLNYHFINWTGTGVTAGKVTDADLLSTTITMDGNYSVQANFAIDRHDLSPSSGSGGSVTVPGQAGPYTYDHGQVVDITAAPDVGYHFTNWTGDTANIANTIAASTTVTIYGNYSIQANFVKDQNDLNISSTLGGTVTVPGEAGPYTYDYDTVVTITAVADLGYHFTGWTGDIANVANTASADTTVTMQGNFNILANFAIDQHNISASAGANGSIFPDGTTIVNYGDNQIFTATADLGYGVDTWWLDTNAVQFGGILYALNNVTQDHTLVVTFKQLKRIISGNISEPDANTPVADVMILTDSDANAVTDANGYYELVVNYNFSGTIEPNKVGWVFEPDSNDFNNVTIDINDVNYIASMMAFSISGHITETDLITPVNDVNVSADNRGGYFTDKYGGGTDLTDVNGFYDIIVDHNWTGTVSPTKYAHTFEPNDGIDYINVLSDFNDQNYTGLLMTYSISGHILDPNDRPLANITVDANSGGDSITDVNGFYELWVGYNWSGTVTPQRQGYYFDPNHDPYVDVLGDYTNMDFMGIRNEDISIDGFINNLDLWYIAEYWLQSDPPAGDLFDDDFMDILDFATLANVWLIEQY
jgi:hypothetical protein